MRWEFPEAPGPANLVCAAVNKRSCLKLAGLDTKPYPSTYTHAHTHRHTHLKRKKGSGRTILALRWALDTVFFFLCKFGSKHEQQVGESSGQGITYKRPQFLPCSFGECLFNFSFPFIGWSYSTTLYFSLDVLSSN